VDVHATAFLGSEIARVADRTGDLDRCNDVWLRGEAKNENHSRRRSPSNLYQDLAIFYIIMTRLQDGDSQYQRHRVLFMREATSALFNGMGGDCLLGIWHVIGSGRGGCLLLAIW
jgi:hypothetical protein